MKKHEVWIGKNTITLEEDNIETITVVGEINEATAIAAKSAHFEFANMIAGKINVLIDLSRAMSASPDLETIGKEIAYHEKTGKIAVFGLPLFARVIASSFVAAHKNANIAFFKTKEESLLWLKEEKNLA